ncbi:MAG: hypothetical protein HYS12_12740 [Planctomycetes bacterium]|nr:hypothetical protein [Planctomycetota bacterium]
MAAHGLPLLRFPPRVPLWPGLLLGVLLAGGAGVAHVSGQWPPDLPVPPDHHLHPVALFGHGFAFAVAFTLLLQWLRLLPRRVELKTCEDRGQTHWASAAILDCLSVLPAKCTLKSYEKKLIDYQARWARTLDRRWLWYYCAALGVFVPGAVLVPLGLGGPPRPLPDPVTLFEPLAVAAVETVVLFLGALRLRIAWGGLLQDWVEAAMEMQKKRVRVRRRQFAPTVRPAPASPLPLASVSDPFFSSDPMTGESPPSIAPGLPIPAAPSQPTRVDHHEETQPTLDIFGSSISDASEILIVNHAGDGSGEIEFVFDNDVDYDPKLSDPS